MVSRAFSTPKNSEELLTIDEYMMYVTTTFMKDKTQTVKDLTVVACNVSQYTVLPNGLWDTHKSAIKWIQNISSVFTKYSTMYEERKSKAEENLAKVIGTLNYDLDNFAATLIFLDRVNDVNKLSEYKLVMKKTLGTTKFNFID